MTEEYQCPDCERTDTIDWCWCSGMEEGQAQYWCTFCGAIGGRELFIKPMDVGTAIALIEKDYSDVH